MIVRRLESHDIDRVVRRVKERLSLDAQRHELVNANFSEQHFADALAHARSQTWVADETGDIVGNRINPQLCQPLFVALAVKL